ncbi:MAG: hypothetical protein WC951_00120 [Bacteroidales bacterium]
MLNSPRELADTPVVVPFTTIDAPGIGSPSGCFTEPFSSTTCASSVVEANAVRNSRADTERQKTEICLRINLSFGLLGLSYIYSECITRASHSDGVLKALKIDIIPKQLGQ